MQKAKKKYDALKSEVKTIVKIEEKAESGLIGKSCHGSGYQMILKLN